MTFSKQNVVVQRTSKGGDKDITRTSLYKEACLEKLSMFSIVTNTKQKLVLWKHVDDPFNSACSNDDFATAQQ